MITPIFHVNEIRLFWHLVIKYLKPNFLGIWHVEIKTFYHELKNF